MRKIKWVGSYRDIPDYKKRGIDSKVRGYHDPRTDTIYLIRGKASRAIEQHEIAHSIKRDPDKPRSAKIFAMHEIRADLYSYKKIGRPLHIKGTLRGLYWDLRNMYGLEGWQSMKMIDEMIRTYAKMIPHSWIRDWVEIKKSG